MIDIPIGKALIAVQHDLKCHRECDNDDYQCKIDCCKGCVMRKKSIESFPDGETCGCVCCNPDSRKDGKNVIFKLIDYPIH